MRRIIAAMLLAAALSDVAVPGISADKVILAEADGAVIFEKNADEMCLIASTTKLMTAIVAVENATLSDVFSVPREACSVEGSSVYLKAGDTMTLEELLEGLLLASGNDTAVAIAIGISGSVDAFTELMNKKATELGMYCTHFTNPHGLDDADHYSSARDLAVLMKEFIRHAELTEIAQRASCVINGHEYQNHNKLLYSCPGCIAGKTGYTMAAGRCLVSCCERENRQLICVTLSDPNDWNDHIALYDWGFAHMKTESEKIYA